MIAASDARFIIHGEDRDGTSVVGTFVGEQEAIEWSKDKRVLLAFRKVRKGDSANSAAIRTFGDKIYTAEIEQ